MGEPESEGIELREVRDDDLDIFFEFEKEPAGIWMAAFTAENPEDRAAFDEHWAKIRAKDDVLIRTIEADGEVAGSVASFVRDGDREVTYWIGKKFWGRGIATAALKQFIEMNEERPLHARVVKDNGASIRVLEKCGFVITGEDRGFAAGRGEEVEEYLMQLS